MYRITLLTILLALELFASYSASVRSGWSLHRNNYDNINVNSISSDADIILSYKNGSYFGLSPSGLYSDELSENNIQTLVSLDAGDAFWTFFSQNGTISLSGDIEDEKKVSLKVGWNLVSITGSGGHIVPSFYFKEAQGIESIWAYDEFNKKWKVYSDKEEILEDINSDTDIDFMETISLDDGLWIYSTQERTIEITELPPYLVDDKSAYTVEEKDMEDFLLKALDPNGDSLTYTIVQDDDNIFQITPYGISFKDINYKPKSSYALRFQIDDGTTTIDKDIVVNINLRVENTYVGEYSLNVGHDPQVDEQWYLDSAHLNINVVHQNYDGSSLNASVVQVVEGGFDSNHNDLIANMDYSMAYDSSSLPDGQNGIEGTCLNDGDFSSHGTAVAGIIGARAYNGIGVRGINPFGKLTCFKFATLSDGRLQPNLLEKAWLNGPRANDIDVSSNSWADCTNYRNNRTEILKEGSESLRDGKGRVYVFAAGNHRIGYGNCLKSSSNLQNMLNSPYSITVAAMNRSDEIASSSNPGSNIFISAYGQDGIWTTYTGVFDYAGFSGTSAAAPMVSGGIALLLEACPDLNYRDVKYILAKSAIKVDTQNSSWVKNSADIYHSSDYGFGKLNIQGAISMCQNNYQALASSNNFETIEDLNQTLSSSGVNNIQIAITQDVKVEWLGVYIDGLMDNIGEYEFNLISPSGTKVNLVHGDNAARDLNLNTTNFILQYSSDEVFRLSSQAFLDESTSGTWVLEIEDKVTSNNQSNRLLSKVKLEFMAY
jgi:subtilisin family serine protease/subtilisin-like proprotein convertase family protein